MWPLLERVIEVWCCRMPSACQSGWFLTVWTRATVPRCHNVRTGQLLCPRRRRPLSNVATARGGTEAWKTVSICKLVVVAAAAYKRLGVVSADGLSFLAPNRTQLESVWDLYWIWIWQSAKSFALWRLIDFLSLNGFEWKYYFPTLLHPPAVTVACWCSVNKRKIIKM